ncbi:hypothetical protein GTA08_BOTSDO05200 [Neofusicoccum parvum]|uniref:Uncharacterized protein n=1 Tax=Neofusicoccum parvum TaxID=310453 RepID=A0ACB5SG10_9PEZI|nr:hypothetical protein GTA08_BOTSDO05200 [Neofusicoccum parvum]
MGNDGGSIPTRRELVKEAARNPTTSELKAAAVEQSTHAWSTDPLSNKPLARPVVSDALGRLYNKDALLEHLLPAADPDDATAAQRKADAEAHVLRGAVRSLKDVVEVRFEVDADAKGEDGAECNEAYAENDVIPIVPTSEEDIARLQLRTKTLKEKGLTHSLKKAGGKKRKKNADGEEKAAEAKDGEKKAKVDGIKNTATASLTAKVLAEQEERNKRRKMENNDNLKSLFAPKEKKNPMGKNKDFFTRGFDIPAQAKR